MYTKQQAINIMNTWGAEQKPFLFIIDFENQEPLIYPLNKVPNGVLFDINGYSNASFQNQPPAPFFFKAKPILFSTYKKAFDCVVKELNYGNSYLLNLIFSTPLHTNLDLKTIFYQSKAKYKLLIDSQFVVFSPEPFIKIEDGIISSYPMKGTIDASLPNAKEKILGDLKEQAEHATIVDLIRNDLSKVASNVKVKDYRYVDVVKTRDKQLLQISSKIEGVLPSNFKSQLGSIIFSLLPAGSISGAPKKKTLEIIKKTEQKPRKYFTGVMGIFDGLALDSGVLIRFIEQKNDNFLFKSGGGITAQSKAFAEYNELLDKVYVPFI